MDKKLKGENIPPVKPSELERIDFGIGATAGFLLTMTLLYAPLEMRFIAPTFFLAPAFFVAYSRTRQLGLSGKLSVFNYGGFLVGEALALTMQKYL